MEFSKATLLIGTIFSDLKNDNLLHYTFQYYSLIVLDISLYIFCKQNNPFIMVWLVYGILPLLDNYVLQDNKNPTKEELKTMKKQFKYKIPIIASIAADWVTLIWAINDLVSTSNGLLYKLGLFMSISIIQATSITLSHEINHKLSKWEKILGTINLSKHFYSHFLIEHNEGHHKNVSTPSDPATSKYNQTLFSFIPQSIIGGYLSAWKIENRICTERYGSAYTYENRMYYFTVSYFLIPLIILMLFNYKIMAIYILIAFFSIFYLEVINYIEHYGLQRKQLDNGAYENVNITHSWNAPHRISNYLLFKLQRHSDHHENSLKPYQTLCSYEESPCLPSGYSACILASFYPKLWFEIINPLVQVYSKGEKPSQELKEKVNASLMRFVWSVNIFLFALVLLQYCINV